MAFSGGFMSIITFGPHTRGIATNLDRPRAQEVMRAMLTTYDESKGESLCRYEVFVADPSDEDKKKIVVALKKKARDAAARSVLEHFNAEDKETN